MSDHETSDVEDSPSEDEFTSSDERSEELEAGSGEQATGGDKPKKEKTWKNWKSFKVKQTVSSRSACPHYKGKKPHGAGGNDRDQNMDQHALGKLKKEKVKCIISANHVQLNQAERKRLTDAGIEYKWVPVRDGSAATSTQFHEVHNTWKDKSHVHFYCGWGHGRTGTYITGVQILEGVYPGPKNTKKWHKAWRKTNKVEEDAQIQALDRLWDEWYKSQ